MESVRIAYSYTLDIIDNAIRFYTEYNEKVPLSVIALTVYEDIQSKVEGVITKTDASIAVMKYFNRHGVEPWMDFSAIDIVEMHVWATQ